MPIWKNSRFDTFYYDDEADCNEPCEVRIDGGRIVVSYESDGDQIVYSGNERGTGHYELTAPQANGRATLHMFEESRVLEGWWEEMWDETKVRGMWRIFIT